MSKPIHITTFLSYIYNRIQNPSSLLTGFTCVSASNPVTGLRWGIHAALRAPGPQGDPKGPLEAKMTMMHSLMPTTQHVLCPNAVRPERKYAMYQRRTNTCVFRPLPVEAAASSGTATMHTTAAACCSRVQVHTLFILLFLCRAQS